MPIAKIIICYIQDAVGMCFKELDLHSLAENALSPPASSANLSIA
jgi:hypothetical protein